MDPFKGGQPPEIPKNTEKLGHISLDELKAFSKGAKDKALKELEKKFAKVMKKLEKDWETALAKYQANLTKIEEERARTNNAEQALNNIAYAKEIFERDINEIKEYIRRSLLI